MRIGINPEKEKARKLTYKAHRVIMPVYIPDDNHEYFKNAVEVFQKSIHSLLHTIDSDNTAITVINNSSKKEITDIIQKLLCQKLIDKHVNYSENKGKVYAVLQEARSCYEEFVTICDADIFFFPNWQNEVINTFKTFQDVGVVGITPDANLAFYCNNSLFSSKFLSVKHGKVVEDVDFELFEKGINKQDFFISKNKNWKQKQYYLEKDNLKVVLGAAHFASTYRSVIFRKLPFQKPIFVFPGGEKSFIDEPIDVLGYGRVSLTKAFAYHMGNSIPEWLVSVKHYIPVSKDFETPKNNVVSILPYSVKTLFVRILKRFLYKI